MPAYLRKNKFRKIEHPDDLPFYIPLKEWATKHNYSYGGAYRRVIDRNVHAVVMGGKWYVFDPPSPVA